VRDTDWVTRALCRRHSNPDLWFASPQSLTTREAKRWCAQCPVTAPCLAEALAIEDRLIESERWGVRGGLTPDERRPLARRPPCS
jgi:WhiB family redox-sensing transcriptional regulator